MRAPGVTEAVALGGAAGVVCASAALDLLGVGALLTLTGLGEAGLGPVSALLLSALPVALVNVLGSFLLGLLWAVSRRRGPQWRPRTVAGLGTGFLGSFTTFSGAVGLLVHAVAFDLSAYATAFGLGGLLAAAAALAGPLIVVLLLLAVLSTAAVVLGLRAGAAPRRAAGDAATREADA